MKKRKSKTVKKPVKKTRAFSKPVKKKQSATRSSINKKPRKQIYYVNLPKGEKTNAIIDAHIRNIELPLKKNPDILVKVTFIAKKNEKEKQSLTNIFRLNPDDDTPQAVVDAASNMWKEISTRPPKNGKDYMKRINKLRGYVNTIVIDYETAGNTLNKSGNTFVPRKKKFQKSKRKKK